MIFSRPLRRSGFLLPQTYKNILSEFFRHLKDKAYYTVFTERRPGKTLHALLDSTGAVVVKYRYDAWGNCKVLDANGTEITDATHIGILNPFRYRSYYFDTETGLYFLKTRYYDPEIGRFMTIDDLSYLDPDSINGLNLYAYCLNNPVMMIDESGCAPAWWQWLLSGLTLAAGIALCFVPGGQVFGVNLIVAGATSMASNILSAVGADSETACIITNVLSIIGGIVLCYTPFASIGASMIGSGFLGIVGGCISEELGESFELGSAIGNVAGGFLGGLIYKGLVNHRIIPFKTSIKNVVENPLDEINKSNIGPKQGQVSFKIGEIKRRIDVYNPIPVIKLPD